MAVQRDEHLELTGLSTAGEHRAVESGHEIQREHPEVVVDAILDTLTLISDR